jgi:flagellar biosynthesis protein FliR
VITPWIGSTPQAPVTFNSTATSELVTGLANGTDYTFTVVAVNAIGPSGSSTNSNDVVPASVPDAPTIGTATTGIASATVSWTAPDFDGGSPLVGYVVTPYVGGVAQPSSMFFSTATTETVTGLTNGATYRFAVQAFNAIGTGGSSAQSDSVTVAPVIPGAATIGTAVFGNGQAVLSWSAPAFDGGSPIAGYEVTPYVGTVAQPSIVFNDTSTTQTITGLTNGTHYTFTVAAFNAVGFGPQSGFSNVVTPATVPDAPTIGTATAGNTSATVSWTPGGNGGAPITGYIVTPYIAAVAQTPVPFNSTATTETVTGLANGTSYTFTVEATNVAGNSVESGQSNAVTPATVPTAPTIGTATGGIAQATVSWTAPSSDGGSPVLGYVVTPFVGFSAKPSTTFPSTATTETVTGLTNGTSYRFKVSAINGVGTGAMSAASNAVTPAPVVPDAPTIGSATGGNASATVSWTAPGFDGGASISGYVVTPYIGANPQTPVPFNSPATTETVTGLVNGTTYTFTVAATNSAGTGSSSSASNAVTPATVAGAPTIGPATAGAASATVTWTAPVSDGGSPISGYVVTPYVGLATGPSTTFNSTATTQVVTGLTPGTAYRFRVRAINGVGTGGFSTVSNSVTPT